ncbi:MAG: hypothetical protein HKN77_00950 [Woeseiaceae bacterium]|nr:hypothetical protein [Woeseiaceae bacterium]
MHYENVVDDTERAVATLLAHCSLDYEEACLRFFDNRRPVRTASSEQVRQPIYRNAVKRWQKYAKQLEPLRRALGPETLARFDT